MIFVPGGREAMSIGSLHVFIFSSEFFSTSIESHQRCASGPLIACLKDDGSFRELDRKLRPMAMRADSEFPERACVATSSALGLGDCAMQARAELAREAESDDCS